MDRKVIVNATVEDVLANRKDNKSFTDDAVKEGVFKMAFTGEYLLRQKYTKSIVRTTDGELFPISEYKLPALFSEMAAISRVFLTSSLTTACAAEPAFDAQDNVTPEALVEEWRKDFPDDELLPYFVVTYPGDLDKFYSNAKNKHYKFALKPIVSTAGVGVNELSALFNADGTKLLSTNVSSDEGREMAAQLLGVRVNLPETLFDTGSPYSERRLATWIGLNLQVKD